VAGGLRRDAQSVGAGVVDDDGDVVLVLREGDERGPLVEGEVEAGASLVVVHVAGPDDAADHLVGEGFEGGGDHESLL
jgi:hypothetical protein